MGRKPKAADATTYKGRVAAEIRRRRLARNLTVAQAAGRAGVPAKTWYHWENAYALPLEALPAIAAALGCRPGTLLPAKAGS